MRRRRDGRPPAGLLSFPGWPTYTDPVLWERDLDQWYAARHRWARAHGVAEADLPASVGDAPFDPALI
ncbi:hypothetical protein [Mycobacterium marinum]|uniref:hypothetical protein n=1 Tax=Mycobacterium marinum TaxID=1781 RepID=UPI000E3CC251|nr:hypothetical protein [Mycobacterium marinum]RFZ30711.1 hypothetical protein KST_05027 [Mycobacterium marinum]GJO60723.1 hypothetical protein NJB1907f34a_00910 [Mycobacterium marinum]